MGLLNWKRKKEQQRQAFESYQREISRLDQELRRGIAEKLLELERKNVRDPHSVDASNVDATVSNLLREIGQPGYDVEAGLKGIQTSQERIDIILSVMHELLNEDKDVTFQAVQEVFAEDYPAIQITPQDYLDASRFHFS